MPLLDMIVHQMIRVRAGMMQEEGKALDSHRTNNLTTVSLETN